MSVAPGVTRVAVVGCGLIGARRALVAADHPHSEVVATVDPVLERAEQLAAAVGGRALSDWRRVIDGEVPVDAFIVSTPNNLFVEIASAALLAGHDVLVEKPMGRNLAEARQLAAAANESGKLLKLGFNHRYHPALARAHELVSQNAIGRLLNIRARYGHGARPGYEHEWRCNPEIAGGGQLTDQGVHLADLIHWFAGMPASAFALLQTAVWPIAPLEDNAFGLFRFDSGVVAQMHASMNQWKNLFSFEVFGDAGYVSVEGLGGSYGVEQLTVGRRNAAGGAPDVEVVSFPAADLSWSLEWEDFLDAVPTGAPRIGAVNDGLAAMRMIDAMYRSAQNGTLVEV